MRGAGPVRVGSPHSPDRRRNPLGRQRQQLVRFDPPGLRPRPWRACPRARAGMPPGTVSERRVRQSRQGRGDEHPVVRAGERRAARVKRPPAGVPEQRLAPLGDHPMQSPRLAARSAPGRQRRPEPRARPVDDLQRAALGRRVRQHARERAQRLGVDPGERGEFGYEPVARGVDVQFRALVPRPPRQQPCNASGIDGGAQGAIESGPSKRSARRPITAASTARAKARRAPSSPRDTRRCRPRTARSRSARQPPPSSAPADRPAELRHFHPAGRSGSGWLIPESVLFASVLRRIGGCRFAALRLGAFPVRRPEPRERAATLQTALGRRSRAALPAFRYARAISAFPSGWYRGRWLPLPDQSPPCATASPATLPPQQGCAHRRGATAGARAGSAALTLVHGVPWLAGHGHSLPTWLVAQPPSSRAIGTIRTIAP